MVQEVEIGKTYWFIDSFNFPDRIKIRDYYYAINRKYWIGETSSYDNNVISVEEKLFKTKKDAISYMKAQKIKPIRILKLTNKELQLIKKEILHYLSDEFEGNCPIFDKAEGYQCFNNTNLTMVMDKVIGGLKAAQNKINKN